MKISSQATTEGLEYTLLTDGTYAISVGEDIDWVSKDILEEYKKR